MSLSDIFAKYEDTDKGTLHSYCEVYEELLKDKRDSIKNVLETGVRKGGSLCGWRDYFSSAKINGIDNGEEMGMWESTDPNRIFVHYADEHRPQDVYKIASIWGPFDFIVHDSCHNEQSQIATYAVLRPHLNSGGIYVIEDCESIDIAKRIATLFGGQVIDRRAVKNRHDDILVVFRT